MIDHIWKLGKRKSTMNRHFCTLLPLFISFSPFHAHPNVTWFYLEMCLWSLSSPNILHHSQFSEVSTRGFHGVFKEGCNVTHMRMKQNWPVDIDITKMKKQNWPMVIDITKKNSTGRALLWYQTGVRLNSRRWIYRECSEQNHNRKKKLDIKAQRDGIGFHKNSSSALPVGVYIAHESGFRTAWQHRNHGSSTEEASTQSMSLSN